MIEMLLGRSSSGKTWQIVERIKELHNKGTDCVLIVPEQFTLQCERMLLRALPDSAVDIPVLSFTRLCTTIDDIVGDSVGVPVSDSDRVILMGRAVRSVVSELRYWTKTKITTEFCSELITAVNELKSCAVGQEKMKETHDLIPQSRLKDKLYDLGLISIAYQTLLERRFFDPMDDLTRLYESVESSGFFNNKTVLFDSFKGFTGQQFKVISKIISLSDNCIFSFTTDGNLQDDTGIFATVNEAARKIAEIAESHNKPVMYTDIGQPRYINRDIEAVEKLLWNDQKPQCTSENISIFDCQDVNEEAAAAAEFIRRQVRINNMRYKDFVVIARDASIYNSAVLTQFRKNSIPVFCDRRLPAVSLPLAAVCSYALKSVKSLNTENILGYLKSGLSPLDNDEISELENYIFVWRIEGKKWFEEWSMNPDGLNKPSKEKDKILERINSLRVKAIQPLINLRNNIKGSPEDMGRALFEFIVECKCADKLNIQVADYEAAGEFELAEAARTSWDTVMELIDNTVRCCETESYEEFSEIWDAALKFTTVGKIPQMLDEVVFGDADRIRPSRPRCVIVLGMNMGVFPAKPNSSGVFADHERAALIEHGIPLPDRTINAVLEENYLVYSSLCCASEKIVITYCSASAGEYRREPSRIIETLTSAFQNLKPVKYSECIVNPEYLPETREVAVQRMASLKNVGGTMYNTLREVLSADEKTKEQVKLIESNYDKGEINLSKDTAVELFGNDVFVSATRFDTFNRCRFSFFCNYGLKAKVLRRADIDVIQKGLIVHFVLEHLFNEYGREISSLTPFDISKKVNVLIKEYLSTISGVESIIDAKVSFVLKKIETIICEIVMHLAEEFAQCEFDPVHCELSIGPDGEVSPPEITLDDGGHVVIVGSVDRLDRNGVYLRVVDYKTGSRTFKLSDTLYGLNMQMLLYLYSVVNSTTDEFKNSLPAGVLYLPARRSIGDDSKLRMNGVILNDSDVVASMEKDNAGRFIPKLNYDKNGCAKSDSFITAEQFGTIFEYIEKMLARMGNMLHNGDVSVSPVDSLDSEACKYCEYSAVCCVDKSKISKVKKLVREEVFEKMKEANGNGV